MNNTLKEEGITALAEVFKILYNVAKREHPELLVAANDNRKNTSDIDISGCDNIAESEDHHD